jgi:hypothetical protein
MRHQAIEQQMTKRKQQYPSEVEDPDDLSKLPADQIVTAAQLAPKPGQRLGDKAKELGVSVLTLRLWTAEWKGSGWAPDYVIKRAGHNNWLRNVWKSKDWVGLVREEVARGRARHVGDILFAVGLTGGNAQCWSMQHGDFEKALWHSGISCPRYHWPQYLAYIRHGTLDRYREIKAEFMAQGFDETTAMHQAGDQAVGELRHKTAQRRRVERDQLLGVGGHEELLKRYRGNARLTDAHSRRIGKKLLQVSRWATMERALKEVGYAGPDVERLMAELMGAFDRSKEEGQAQWKKTRQAVLRRRAEADAYARVEQVEAGAVTSFTERRKRTAPIVARWAMRNYDPHKRPDAS